MAAKKVNGFTRPWNNYQVALWFVFGFLTASFHFWFGLSSHHWAWLVNAINVILSIIVFGSSWMATSTNVVDSKVLERGYPVRRVDGKTIEDWRKHYQDTGELTQLKYCHFCCSFVNGNSKHCRACDRCTEGFDHHCKWFNNCVSAKNYRAFFIAMVSFFFLLALHIIVSVGYLSDTQWPDVHLLSVPPSLRTFAHLLHLIVCTLLMAPLIHLLSFHIYLCFTKQSTYDWIMHRRQLEDEKTAPQLPTQDQQQLHLLMTMTRQNIV